MWPESNIECQPFTDKPLKGFFIQDEDHIYNAMLNDESLTAAQICRTVTTRLCMALRGCKACLISKPPVWKQSDATTRFLWADPPHGSGRFYLNCAPGILPNPLKRRTIMTNQYTPDDLNYPVASHTSHAGSRYA